MNKILKKNKITGYTLLEITVTIVILGVIASVAVPRYLMTIEKTRSGEGIAMLSAMRQAQEGYKLEHSGYASSLGDLDVEFSAAPQYFDDPLANNADPVASVERTNGDYILCISGDGTLECEESTEGICAKIGIAQGDCSP